ncbi:hypothetical protein IIU_07044 [Bacillus cereus VD133]|uniref:Uncharacterized protein n=1 Tax=Bacillus cereus VD133 TaxID=1053233 RepID=A0A9W5UYQ1_BACCE|nr:hypothetical protein IIU_07044 [Bacillus cereus VD133]
MGCRKECNCNNCKKNKKKFYDYHYKEYYVKKCHCRCSFERFDPHQKKECKDDCDC